MKPITPIQRVERAMINTIILLRSEKRRVGRSVDKIIITPPIVGVPLFAKCDSGPLLRISSPI